MYVHVYTYEHICARTVVYYMRYSSTHSTRYSSSCAPYLSGVHVFIRIINTYICVCICICMRMCMYMHIQYSDSCARVSAREMCARVSARVRENERESESESKRGNARA